MVKHPPCHEDYPCKIHQSSATSKTKLYFNVRPKRVSRWQKNNPWYSFPKGHSFAAYCAYNMRFYLVRTRIHSFIHVPFSPVVSLGRARLCACPYPLIEVYPYLPTAFCTFDPKSVPNVLHRS